MISMKTKVYLNTNTIVIRKQLKHSINYTVKVILKYTLLLEEVK